MTKESNPEMWEYPAHTKAKHDILNSYLGGWFPKLSSQYSRVLFFDGFAGRGKYNDGTDGSPLIALKKLLDHSYFKQMGGCEFVFLFVEKDRANADILTDAVAEIEATYGPRPANVKITIEVGEFEKTASEIAAAINEQKKKLAPTFAFIDPFGYTGLPLEVIADLLKYNGSEVFINFMVGHVQRFIMREGQESAIQGLFGMSPADVMENYDNDQSRVEHLRDVYVNQLRDVAKFPYVNCFAMHNETGNISYYLLHGTRHREGVKLMKAAMWKADPGAGSSFSDRLANQVVLFQPDPDLVPLEGAIKARYAVEGSLNPEDIRWFAVLETPYREVHVTKLLRKWEKDGTIVVVRSGNSKSGYNGDTTRVWFRR